MKNLNYFNLNQIKSNPDGQTTVKRQSRVMSQSGCSAVDVPMTSYGAPDEHPMRIRSASDGTRWNSRGWKYVAMIFAVLVMSVANVGMAWGADKYYILGAQAVASDGALTKASSHSNLTLKYIKYNGSTYSTTTDISFSATDGINGKYESSAESANISSILTSAKWGTGSGAAYAAGIKFAKNTTYTLSLGSKTITKISFLIYPEGKASSITIGGTAKTTSSKEWTLHEWTGSFTGNVSMSLSNDNGVYGVFILETAAATGTYYYRGEDNSWGSTAMTASVGGTYEYIATTRNNHQFKITTCNEAVDTWSCANKYNYSYVDGGFYGTSITTIGDYSKDNCYIWSAPASYYIIVFKPNTAINTTNNPKICASATLPQDQFTISFNKGSGSGTMSSITSINAGSDHAVTANSFTAPIGYRFAGWKANVDVKVGGSTKTAGTVLADGVTIQSILSDITLTAQWELIPTYDVTYNANLDGASGSTSGLSDKNSGFTFNVAANGFSKTGYKFKWWHTAANGTSGVDYYTGEPDTVKSADINLYAQWESVADDEEYWVGNPFSWSSSKITVGDMVITAESTNAVDLNGTLTKATTSTQVNKQGGDYRHAKVMALKTEDKYLQIHFSDGKPINKLYLGSTTNNTGSKKVVVVYSATSDFTTAGGAAHEFVTVGETSNTVTLAGYNQETKAVTDVSPSLENTYYYARIYKKITTANTVFDNTANLGDGATMRIYSIKAQKGVSCSTPAAPTNFTAGSISATGATFTITDAADAASYDIYYSTSSTAPTSGTDATTTSTSKTKEITGLTAATTYYAWVRSVCDASHKSAWVALNPGGDTHTFATSCVAPTTVNVTATVNSVAGFQFYPDDDVVLTAAPTGSPAGSPVTYQWKKNGADIDGATSSTYTINDAAASDAGKYTCTISYGACSTTSAEFSLKCMQFYLKNSSGGDISNHALTKVDATHARLDLSLTGGTTYLFRVTDGCNDWYGNSDETGMTSSNCTNWTMPHDADCKMTTNSKTGTYTFNFDFTGGVLGSEMKVSIVYPGGDQAAGKIIYWDNSVLNWEEGDQWYRIGKNGHNNKTRMTLVPGTANLYKVITAAYDGFEYWHIANNDGDGTTNIFWTKGDAAHAITHAMAFEAAPVTASAVTVTPGTDHSTGASSDNDNCEFYSKTITNGMKTDRVTISQPSNGTITIYYTNENGVSSSSTAAVADMNEDLAHTVILTSITTSPNEGYDAGAITINGSAYSGANYVVTGATTIAASFTPQTYSITYKDQGGADFSGTHTDTPSAHPTSHTYNTATNLNGATKAGYTFGGWYTSPDCLTGLVTSLGATDYTADITLYAKWTEDVAPCPTGGDIFTLEMTYSGSEVSVAANTVADWSASYGTKDGGDVKFGNVNGSSAGKIKIQANQINLGSNDGYIKLILDCPLKQNDVLSFTSSGNYELCFTTDDSYNNSVKSSSKKWTVPKSFNNESTIYIWRASTNTNNIYTINIVRPVTVTFDKNGGSSVSPSSATYDGTSSSVLASATRTDYHLDGWNTKSDGSGDDLGLPGETYYLDDVTTSTTTIYAQWSAKSCASGTIYQFTLNTGLENDNFPKTTEVYVKTSDYLATMTGGYLKAYNSSSDKLKITDNKYICINSSSSYLLVQLDCPLRAGDQIKSTVKSQALYITKGSDSRASTYSLPVADNNVQTIPAAWAGATEIKIWASSSNGGKIQDFQIIRAASTYNVTYDDNDATSGDAPEDDTNYDYNAEVTVASNSGTLAMTNYSTLAYWNTKEDGSGTDYAIGSGTFNITDNTTLYAKWTQAVTLDANTANHGSVDGSATAVWNATALTGITHATPASGYKLTGYYTAATEGTKVLNSDGTFASLNVTDYITSGKWSRTDEAPTLYAQYEASGSLKWNLGVNTEATSLTTSSKESSFTQIAVANMGDATLSGSTYAKSAKSSLTGQISSPATKSDYVYVTFKVADGYKFTPSNISVKVQPVGENEHKAVELSLADATNTLASSSATKCNGTSSGTTTTVTLAGNGTYFTGTVTLKIYVYAHATASATNYNCYRLGTPIEIQGAVEATCEMPSFTGLDYDKTSYTVDETASAISVTGASNVSYLWKQNSTNDRSGITPASGTNNEASYTPPTGAAGTMYYWCELTNACGTVKTPAVGITVSVSKSDATISWTGTSASANYGGGGYTVKATVNEIGWNGNAADLTLSAPAGIRIYNIESGETASKKWVQASFDVTTAFDRETYSTTIPFTVSADATATYNAISDEEDVTFDACTGGGGASDVWLMPVNTDSLQTYNWRFLGKGKIWNGYGSSSLNSSNVKSLETNMEGGAVTKYYKGSGSIFCFYTEHAITGVRLYVYTSNSDITVSNVYISNSAFTSSTPSSGAVTFEAVYNDDNDGLDKGTDGSAWTEITFGSEVAAGKYGFIKLSGNVNIAGIALISGSSSGAELSPTLSFATAGPITKQQSSANFTNALTIGGYPETLGAITYTSSNTSCATVNATTGEVTITASGSADLSTTITATLAASGCYRGATASYVINVAGVTCEVNHGTLSSDVTSKCETEYATLTLTDFESGASVQWYNGETPISDGSTYDITTEGTTSTMETKEAGTYSVMVTKDACSDRSNSITITNKSTTVHVTRLVKEWYIKNGRLTPDIALWELGDDCSFVSVTASDGWDEGTDLTEAKLGEKVFYEQDGIVYMKGTEPKANAGAVQNYTLTLTVNDGCGNQTLTEEGKKITIHHQQNTDKHVLAFVVNGTEKGDWTAGVTADQTTNVGLYNAIAAQFDVQATNIYSTDDEQKLREYYSQYDILCITDYPNTKTKGVNSKSYVDAIGALIDIRPILTMEAFVSSLANWRAKGISGNPKSPTTRQYTMDLQCKDHEIFAGTDLTKVGEGDEAMYRVSMVDNTKEDYATLDATYGDGAHADKSGYEYASKPALQGFTFTEEMANDLLPIGLIDDGAGNPLQVGIERQRNMEARLMVLGINSYAMERLTNDGERVVINALNYLMKKNAEDIADCSTSFVGGAEGHEKNWDYADNWTGNTVPLPTQKVRILADCEVSSTVYAQSVLIVTDGQYNHGSDNAAGKLTIKENGALIVSGKIQAASAPAYNRPRATTPDKLLIETSSTNQAALIFDNEEGETQATVKLYSLGRKPSSYQYQYFAVPMEVVPVNPVFANETHGGTGIYTYVYNEATSGWTRRGYYDDLLAFEGLGITTKSETAMNYTMTGNLASTATKEITLTKNGRGLNLIGNSWMAPIQIGALAEDNTDANITKTVYIYCAGRDAVEGAATSGVTETAGQWIAIPFSAAEFATWKATGKLSVIPAMQAFEIKTAAEATLTLDYDKVVRGSTNDLNAKLRAPGRRMAANEVTMTNIRVADSKTHTDLSLFEGDRFSEAFDNGWEAEYMNGDGRSAKLYAETETGKMAVVAMEDYEGTVVGFAPGKETEYTFSFMGEDNGYYLNDIKLKNSVRISEGETYTFTYEEGDAANRFYISRQPLGGPAITTGVDEVREEAKPRKFIYNDKMYILFNGRVFDATGKAVK